MVEDCIGRGKSVQEGGAIYNFSGPQGFGVANMADAMWAVKTLVYEQHKYTLEFYKEALENNYGEDMDLHRASKSSPTKSPFMASPPVSISLAITVRTYTMGN